MFQFENRYREPIQFGLQLSGAGTNSDAAEILGIPIDDKHSLMMEVHRKTVKLGGPPCTEHITP